MTFLHKILIKFYHRELRQNKRLSFMIARPTFLIIIFSILLMQVFDNDTEKATSCTQSSASAPQRSGSAQPSSSARRILSCQATGGTGVRLQRVSRVCKEESLQFMCSIVGSIQDGGKRPGTITNPECTLDAIFSLLTPGLH